MANGVSATFTLKRTTKINPMKLQIYQVDAFTEKVFGGNPAAVCPLDEWLSDAEMQNIAAENNLAETAFFVKQKHGFEIRWFTPSVEVDLCGHATLATAHVLFSHLNYEENQITFFSSRSGELKVSKNEDLLTLDFPSDVFEKIDMPLFVSACFQIEPVEAYKGKTDLMFVFNSETDIKNIIPDFKLIGTLGGRGVIVTAKGDQVDFVSRFFAPQSGIDEDPVTGSAHTTLTPFWYKQLGKDNLIATQLSPRKGHLLCRFMGERVQISGKAVTYLKGEIDII
jgi:PhzF family phenazine biosynthesis protein